MYPSRDPTSPCSSSAQLRRDATSSAVLASLADQCCATIAPQLFFAVQILAHWASNGFVPCIGFVACIVLSRSGLKEWALPPLPPLTIGR